MNIPARIKTPPTILINVGFSWKMINPNMVEPIGSPKSITETKEALTYFNDQLNDECPSSCGTTPNKISQTYVIGV